MAYKLKFDGADDYVQTNGPHIESITADFTLEVKLTTGASESGDSVVMVRESDRSNYLIVDQNANNIRFKMDNINTWNVSIAASTDYVVKITRASGVLTCELDGVALPGNPTDTGWLRIDNLGRWSSSFYKDIGLHYVHFVCPSIPSADRLYDARNTSSGSVLPETINGQNGTLIGFPVDNSQWVEVGAGFTYTLPTISGSHANFPVVLKTADFPSAALDGASQFLNGGGNLRAYTNTTKTTQLPVEVVNFVVGASPNAEVYVKVPTAATGSTIYIEADDVAVSQPAVTDTYGRNAVWADYDCVYHFSQDPSGAPPQLVDSTGNNNDLTTGGSMTSGDLIAGQVGDALAFDGVNDATIKESPAISSGFNYGVSGVVRVNSGSSSYLSEQERNSTGNLRAIIYGYQAGKINVFNRSSYPTGNANDTAMTFGQGVFRHFSYTTDGTTLRGEVDGTELVNVAGELNPEGAPTRLRIGTSGGSFINADFDEWRQTALYRDANWYATENDNLMASLAWGTVGTWTGAPAGGAVTGTGSHQASPAAHSGTGTRTVTGSGSHQADVAAHSGTGARSVTGSGSHQADAASHTGSGSSGAVITGSGSHQAGPAVHAGTGTRTVTGSGSHQAGPASHSGSGTSAGLPGVSGSGAHQAGPASHSGSGLRVIQGSGASQAGPATHAGVALRVIQGTGASQAGAAGHTGTGTRTVLGAGAHQAGPASHSGYDIGTPSYEDGDITLSSATPIYSVTSDTERYDVTSDTPIYKVG